MKAVVYKEPFRVGIEEVPDPEIKHPNDAIVRITSSCICGSDLHMYEGRTAAEPGIVFGHENMGVIEEVGSAVKTRKVGDRVVLPFNVACGFCKKLPRWVYGVLYDGQPRFRRRGIRVRGDGPVGRRTGGISASPVRGFQRAAPAGG